MVLMLLLFCCGLLFRLLILQLDDQQAAMQWLCHAGLPLSGLLIKIDGPLGELLLVEHLLGCRQRRHL